VSIQFSTPQNYYLRYPTHPTLQSRGDAGPPNPAGRTFPQATSLIGIP
jgi:hypothetical protein